MTKASKPTMPLNLSKTETGMTSSSIAPLPLSTFLLRRTSFISLSRFIAVIASGVSDTARSALFSTKKMGSPSTDTTSVPFWTVPVK